MASRLRWLLVTLLLVTIAHAQPARAAQGPDVAYERSLMEDLSRRAPRAVEAWERANRARDARRIEEAREAYSEVVALAPEFDAGHRRLCSVLQDRAAAIGACRRALELKTSWENQAGLALVLARSPEGRVEAQRLADLAEASAPREASVVGLQADLALKRKDAAAFLRFADRLAQIAPGDPQTAGIRTLAALFRGETEAARAALDEAKAAHALDPDAQAHLESSVRSLEAQWTPQRIAETFGVVVGLWLVVAALLFAAGSWLSRATLRATEVEVARGAHRTITAGTRALRRAYGALLGFASVYYYASLPLVAALVVALAGGLIYGAFAIGRIPIKLVLIALVIVAVSLWAIAKSLYIAFRPGRSADPGEEVILRDHPKLAALLASVAARIGTRPVDRVFLTPHTDMAVFERGGAIATARGRGERCLIVGAGLVRGMRIGSLKGVVAHEMGHFKNEDTAGGALCLAVRRSMVQMLVALVQGGSAAVYNPAWLFATTYHRIFLRISQGASRLQEVLADRWAVLSYGSQAFIDGFEHVLARTVEHDERVQSTFREVIGKNLALANFFTHEVESPPDADEVERKKRDARSREADPFDSHPPPRERIEAARALDVLHAPEPEDDEDAWTLFENRGELEALLTDRICEAVSQNHDVAIRRAEAGHQ